ncbi:MAG TPA: potassium-transporting ATPase subunit KdpC [Candidatus Melainabacteria bacterium]|nr:potassium-transporting ATPase subunit KdpC [Candidatus Melainabacteria bacterium]
MKEVAKSVLQSFLLLLTMTVITGVIYPVAVTAVAQAVFKHQANGSLVRDAKGKVFGSELLGQQFSQDKYFYSRPSATGSYAYNAAGSCGSNLGPTNQDLLKLVRERTDKLRRNHPNADGKIPTDLVTASSSGLDPHISVESAEFQIARVANARGLGFALVKSMVQRETEPRQYNIFGEPRVNVLKLNLALDKLK